MFYFSTIARLANHYIKWSNGIHGLYRNGTDRQKQTTVMVQVSTQMARHPYSFLNYSHQKTSVLILGNIFSVEHRAVLTIRYIINQKMTVGTIWL